MYVLDSKACDLPNSETPMSAAAIAAQNAAVGRVGSWFTAGNDALNNLIRAGGGNPPTAAAGDAGVATTGGGPGAGAVQSVYPPGYGWGVQPGGLFPGTFDNLTIAAKLCSSAPEVLPLVTVLPIPVMVAPSVPAPSSVPAAGGAARPDPSDCLPVSSENICRLLRDGCVVQSQVTSDQLAACARAGWSGNRNLFPWVAARGGVQNGAYFGNVNLAPLPASGVGGLEDFSPVLSAVALAATIGGFLWFVSEYESRHASRRRRK